MGTYEPLAESLREMNRLLMESRTWDSQQKQNEAAWGLRELQLKNQLQNDAQQRKINEAKVMEAEEAMRPQAINVFSFLNKDAVTRDVLFNQNNGAMGKEIAAAFGPGFTIGADGQVMRPDGRALELNKMQFDRGAPALYSIATKYNDPMNEINMGIQNIDNQLSKLDESLKSVSAKDPRMQSQRAKLLAQKSTLEKQRNGFSAKANDYDYRIKELENDLKDIESFGIGAATYGNNPQLMNQISQDKAHKQRQIEMLQKAKISEQLELNKDRRAANRLAKEGTGLVKMAIKPDGTDARLIPVPKNVGNKGMLPESLDPDLKGYVWNEQYTATESNLAKTGKGWKDEFNAVTGMFRDNEGVIRQGLDTQSEVIALRELADLRDDPEGKAMSPTDRIMAAYTYPERALKEYKQVMTQALEANKDNPDAAKIAMQNIRNTWISLYGFTPEAHEELLAGKLE